MTNVTALPPLTVSHSHLQCPSPVLPPGTVLPWRRHARCQVCSVHRTGTPAGSASCSPRLHSWHSSGDLLGPEDAQTDTQERVRDCTHRSGPKLAVLHSCLCRIVQCHGTGPRSHLKSLLTLVNASPRERDWSPFCSPAPHWLRKAAASTVGRVSGTGTRLPPLPRHPLRGNLDLALRSLTSSNGTWYPLPMALLHPSTRHHIPHGNSHSPLWDLATHPSMHPDLLPSLGPSFSRGRPSGVPIWDTTSCSAAKNPSEPFCWGPSSRQNGNERLHEQRPASVPSQSS